PVNSLIRKRPSGSIGSFTRSSMPTNATSSTAAPASSATIAGLPQPSSLPRSSASTKRKRAPTNAVWPAQSIRRAFESRDSRTHRYVAPTAALPTGAAADLDRHVHVEDPAPAEVRGDRTADCRADGERRADRGAVDGQGLRALL